MKQIQKLFAVCAVALCACFGLSSCSQSTVNLNEKSPIVEPPAIAEAGVLRVGVDASNPPFAAQGSGKIVGIDVDVAAALADQLGLKLQLKDVGSDLSGALDAGDVDIVLGLDKSNTQLNCWTSQPYVETAVALFAPQDVSDIPTEKSKPKIAAQSASMSAWEVSNQFGDSALVSTNDLTQAFSALKDKKANYVAADASIGSYVASSNSESVHIVALMKKASGYSVGVKKDNTRLQEAVSSVLEQIKQAGVVKLIEAKWFGESIDLSSVDLLPTARNMYQKKDEAAKTDAQDASEKNEDTKKKSEDSKKDSKNKASRQNHLNVPTDAGQPAA